MRRRRVACGSCGREEAWRSRILEAVLAAQPAAAASMALAVAVAASEGPKAAPLVPQARMILRRNAPAWRRARSAPEDLETCS